MLVEALFVFGDGRVVFLPDVVDQDNTVLSTAGDQIGVLVAELAGSDFAVVVEYLLGEGWVLQGPEHEQSSLARSVPFSNVLITDSQ